MTRSFDVPSNPQKSNRQVDGLSYALVVHELAKWTNINVPRGCISSSSLTKPQEKRLNLTTMTLISKYSETKRRSKEKPEPSMEANKKTANNDSTRQSIPDPFDHAGYPCSPNHQTQRSQGSQGTITTLPKERRTFQFPQTEGPHCQIVQRLVIHPGRVKEQSQKQGRINRERNDKRRATIEERSSIATSKAGPRRRKKRPRAPPVFSSFQRTSLTSWHAEETRRRVAKEERSERRNEAIDRCMYVRRYAYRQDRCGPRRYENERYIGT